jgi:hypothetical protein
MSIRATLVPPAQVDIRQTFDDAVQAVIDFVPRLLLFLVILIIGWIIARVLRTVLQKILEKARFDQAVQRGSIGDALANTRYNASGLVAAVLYYAVLLIALQLAFNAFGPNPVSELLDSIVAWLPNLAVAIVIVLIAGAIAGVVRDLLAGMLGGVSYGAVLARLASWFILALGIIAALNQIGVAEAVTTPILVAALATLGGLIVVGVGGGMIRPMQSRWERWISRAEEDLPAAQSQADTGADTYSAPADTRHGGPIDPPGGATPSGPRAP